MATIHHSTQTVCSFKIRMAVKNLGCFMMMGEPTIEKMREILLGAGFENILATITENTWKHVPISQLIWEYAQYRNFDTWLKHTAFTARTSAAQ